MQTPDTKQPVVNTVASETLTSAASNPQTSTQPIRAQNIPDWRNRTPIRPGPGSGPGFVNSPRGYTPNSGGSFRQHVNDYHQSAIMNNSDYVQDSLRATDEGRRLYFGNLDHQTVPEDVALWLEGAGFQIKVIDIPARDENTRKPVFCFVEFFTKEAADEVLRVCNMRTMRGRQVRIDHSKRGNRQFGSNMGSINNENTPMKPQPSTAATVGGNRLDFHKLTIGDENSGRAVAQHRGATPNTFRLGVQPSSRLFVGGLPNIENTNELDDLIMELFRGFQISSISTIHQSKDPKAKEYGNNSFCFVDVPDVANAKMAIDVLNNRETAWGTARVNFATGGTAPVRNKYRGGNNSGAGSGTSEDVHQFHQPQQQQQLQVVDQAPLDQ